MAESFIAEQALIQRGLQIGKKAEPEDDVKNEKKDEAECIFDISALKEEATTKKDPRSFDVDTLKKTEINVEKETKDEKVHVASKTEETTKEKRDKDAVKENDAAKKNDAAKEKSETTETNKRKGSIFDSVWILENVDNKYSQEEDDNPTTKSNHTSLVNRDRPHLEHHFPH